MLTKNQLTFSLTNSTNVHGLISLLVACQAFLPLVDGSYEWADGKSVERYDATVVAVHIDTSTEIG